jgi:hypothetical protein
MGGWGDAPSAKTIDRHQACGPTKMTCARLRASLASAQADGDLNDIT